MKSMKNNNLILYINFKVNIAINTTDGVKN